MKFENLARSIFLYPKADFWLVLFVSTTATKNINKLFKKTAKTCLKHIRFLVFYIHMHLTCIHLVFLISYLILPNF